MLFATQDSRWPAGETACEDLSFQGGGISRTSTERDRSDHDNR